MKKYATIEISSYKLFPGSWDDEEMKKHNSPLACSKTSQKRPAEDYQDNLGTEDRNKKKNKWKEKNTQVFRYSTY